MFNRAMPQLIFITKFGTAIAFLSSYFACFTDERIFPIHRRTTAIGICNFCARGLTGLAPMVNELSEPFPMFLFNVIVVGALINTALLKIDTLPSEIKPNNILK